MQIVGKACADAPIPADICEPDQRGDANRGRSSDPGDQADVRRGAAGDERAVRRDLRGQRRAVDAAGTLLIGPQPPFKFGLDPLPHSQPAELRCAPPAVTPSNSTNPSVSTRRHSYFFFRGVSSAYAVNGPMICNSEVVVVRLYYNFIAR
jgi:hypothetical protein